MSINTIYNKLYCGDVVQVSTDPASYETIRTGLLRKYKTTAALMAEIGDTAMQDNYISASYSRATCVATFAIKPNTERKRKAISFTLL